MLGAHRNLVVHREPRDTDDWRTSAAHDRAVAISPGLYQSIRIHNGHLDGGVAGNGAIVVDRTKYWDYDEQPAWRAEREFDPPLRRVRAQRSAPGGSRRGASRSAR